MEHELEVMWDDVKKYVDCITTLYYNSKTLGLVNK